MHSNKKTVIAICIAAGIAVCATASAPPGEFKNLKVLPKNISSKELSKIMVDDFAEGLGVSCGFCHAENKETHKPDYASDENPEKKIAREMMRMTTKINKRFFKINHPVIGNSSLAITCSTCHRGAAFPEEK
jgi:photosynthetic reaction center cytochrome c subunit